jgi:hypothetical protein
MFCVFGFGEQLHEWQWIGGAMWVLFLIVLGGKKTENNCGNGNDLVIWESSIKSTSYDVLNVVNVAIVRKKKNREH